MAAVPAWPRPFPTRFPLLRFRATLSAFGVHKDARGALEETAPGRGDRTLGVLFWGSPHTAWAAQEAQGSGAALCTAIGTGARAPERSEAEPSRLASPRTTRNLSKGDGGPGCGAAPGRPGVLSEDSSPGGAGSSGAGGPGPHRSSLDIRAPAADPDPGRGSKTEGAARGGRRSRVVFLGPRSLWDLTSKHRRIL